MIALSYSRISDFRQCPLKFKLKYLDKEPEFKMEEKSVHLVRGENVHRELENYVVKKRAGEQGIPASSLPEVESAKKLIDGLMSIYDVHPEHKVAINDKFEQVDWFAKSAWFRAIFDLVGFNRQGTDLLLGDYKTGKFTDYSGTDKVLGQLHLSAIVGDALWNFSQVNTVYIYVDHKKTIKESFTSEHLHDLREVLVREHELINAETAFKATPNAFCGWCDSTKRLCPHSRKA